MMSLSRLLIGPALEQRACHARRGPAHETTRSSRIELVIYEWVVAPAGAEACRKSAHHCQIRGGHPHVSRAPGAGDLKRPSESASSIWMALSLRESTRVQAWHPGCRGGQRTNRFVEPTMKAVPSATIAV